MRRPISIGHYRSVMQGRSHNFVIAFALYVTCIIEHFVINMFEITAAVFVEVEYFATNIC